MGETLVGGRFLQVEVVGVDTEFLSFGVDVHRLRIAQHDIRTGVEHLGRAQQVVARVEVVMRRTLEIGAASARDQRVPVPAEAVIHIAADVSHAVIPIREHAADLLGAIGRPVVADEDLVVVEGLVEQRLERELEVLVGVVDRTGNGDLGRHGVRRVAVDVRPNVGVGLPSTTRSVVCSGCGMRRCGIGPGAVDGRVVGAHGWPASVGAR